MILPCADYSSSSLQNLIHARIPIGVIKSIFPIFCVNPAVNLGEYLKKGRSAVFFSATLLPMNYYRKLLSNRQDDYGIYVESPFSQKNRCILNAGDVSSLYSRRGYEEYHKIAEYIAKTVWQRKGNYMVFFQRELICWEKN